MPEIENLNINQPQGSNKKVVLIVLIIILAVLAVIVFRSALVSRFKKEQIPSPTQSVSAQVSVIPLPLNTDTIKKEFPLGMPIESGVQILSSSKQKHADSSRNLVSTQFISKKTLNENLVTYENFLKTSNYQITNKTDNNNFVALYAVNSGGATFIFSASIDAQKRVLVSLAYSL